MIRTLPPHLLFLTLHPLVFLKLFISLQRLWRQPGGGGDAILIKNNIPFTQIPVPPNLSPDLEIIGIQIRAFIFSIYIAPRAHILLMDWTILFSNFPQKAIFMGNFNIYHPILGSAYSNSIGEHIYQAFLIFPIQILNDPVNTHLAQDISILDLTIITSDLSLQANWLILTDTYNSDHFPISLDLLIDYPRTTTLCRPYIRKNFNRTDWSRFQDLISNNLCGLSDYSISDLMRLNDSLSLI